MCVCVCVCVRERESVCVCVIVTAPFSPATSGSVAVCEYRHFFSVDTTSDLELLALAAIQERALPRTLHQREILYTCTVYTPILEA